MLSKTISKPKFLLFTVFGRFSSPIIEDQLEIKTLKGSLDNQSLKNAIEQKGLYYVNKIDKLCEFVNHSRSIAIFRPRRMGKTTMIEDIAYMHERSKYFIEIHKI